MRKLLLLTLKTFSATGGIEKVCRVAGKALYEISEAEQGSCVVYSMYDGAEEVQEQYFPGNTFKGFKGKKLPFILAAVSKGASSDVVILSHINLLLVGYLIKKISPKTRLLLIAHGIEVWEPVRIFKSKMLQSVDLFLPVSDYTGQKLRTTQHIASQKISILNNCLDPFLKKVSDKTLTDAIKKRHSITMNDIVLFTLTRLKSSERYKGYDKVIAVLPALSDQFPKIKFLIAGKYDDEEKQRLDGLIAQHNVKQQVIFTGFLSDEEVAAHFDAADIYIMPSTGEGFGIVFIEALFFGKPVIAGNQDGSPDALRGGQFGKLVNPFILEEIINALSEVILQKEKYIPDASAVQEAFGFSAYKKNWHQLIYPQSKKVFTEHRELNYI